MPGDDEPVRNAASILHLDLDAFFASVEQRDKPSLRGKPVIVGGVGQRGVVATASYEARRFGVRSAMSTAEARSRCPHAAFLVGRFDAYRASSRLVMRALRRRSTLVEPLSLDEAFIDLAAAPEELDLSPGGLDAIAAALKAEVHEVTRGLTASVGIGTSKLIAKIASDLDKPDGAVVIPPGSEQDLLGPLQVTVIPGVGPATAARLRQVGVHTVEELRQISAEELVRIVGQSHGASLYALARADDDRPVVAERETKSVSVEDTFEHDLVDPVLLAAIIDRHARNVCERLTKAKLSGRTVTVKVRLHDFTTLTRSATIAGPTDRPALVSRLARGLIAEIDTSGGVRLLGVGVSGLADWIQEDLFADEEDALDAPLEVPESDQEAARTRPRHGSGWMPGVDVEHPVYGPGWVWGSGLGRVTVRFETAETGPGPVRTLASDDPDLVRRPVVVPDDEDEDKDESSAVSAAVVVREVSDGSAPGLPDEPAHTPPAPRD
jgi:DNA polymerase-4